MIRTHCAVNGLERREVGCVVMEMRLSVLEKARQTGLSSRAAQATRVKLMVSLVVASKARRSVERMGRCAKSICALASSLLVLSCSETKWTSEATAGEPLVVFEGFDDGKLDEGKEPHEAIGAGDTAVGTLKRSGANAGSKPSTITVDDETGIDLDAVDFPEPPNNPHGSMNGAAAPGVAAAAPGVAAEQLPIVEADGPTLAATKVATIVYKKPNTSGQRLGYIRLGGLVRRDADPVPGVGCKGQWYRIYPVGYVCTDEGTVDLNSPLVRATRVRPALDKPLPYAYGFVRATAPQYLRIPTKAEQIRSEFKLEEHLQWYKDNYHEVQRVSLGANDVPLTPSGAARLGVRPGSGFRLSSQLSITEMLGGSSPEGMIPFWLTPKRLIPNVSAFEVPEYALFADRVRRKTGLSFVDSFVTHDDDITRRFAVTVDMRLIPATKVKPDTASPFHGVEITDATELPFGIVNRRSARTWKLIKGRDEAREDVEVPRRAVVPLTGKARIKAGKRFYQIARSPTRWLRADDVGVVALPPDLPPEADRGEKWIDVSLVQQTLTLFEGRKPVYATLVSTGKDRLGDPKTTLATPIGTFRIQSKHIAAAMDSEENSSVSGGSKVGHRPQLSGDAAATTARLLAAEKAGTKLSPDDQLRLKNIKRGRHPEYGVTMRRGSGGYELRDVPWIQYFEAGYALHGAYWHDVFGFPRSHGCINLAPIDARYVFMWTDPPVPDGWHGFNVGEDFGKGTLVRVRE